MDGFNIFSAYAYIYACVYTCVYALVGEIKSGG
jgi:hypothetical protein